MYKRKEREGRQTFGIIRVHTIKSNFKKKKQKTTDSEQRRFAQNKT